LVYFDLNLVIAFLELYDVMRSFVRHLLLNLKLQNPKKIYKQFNCLDHGLIQLKQTMTSKPCQVGQFTVVF